MKTYKANVRAGNGIIMPVTVEAEHRMHAIQMVDGMYGAENVLMPAYEVFEAYTPTPVRGPAPSVDALSEAKIKEKEANAYKYALDFTHTSTPSYAPTPSYALAIGRTRARSVSQEVDLNIATVFLVLAVLSVPALVMFV
jgi:hypothetical protein